MVADCTCTLLSVGVASILKTQAEHSKLLNEILSKLDSISYQIPTSDGQTHQQNGSFPPLDDSAEAEANKSNSTEQNIELETPVIDSVITLAPVKCIDPHCTCLTCCPLMVNEFEVKPEPEVVDQNIVESQNHNCESRALIHVSTTPEQSTKPCFIKLIKLNVPPLPAPEPQNSIPLPIPVPPRSQINCLREIQLRDDMEIPSPTVHPLPVSIVEKPVDIATDEIASAAIDDIPKDTDDQLTHETLPIITPAPLAQLYECKKVPGCRYTSYKLGTISYHRQNAHRTERFKCRKIGCIKTFKVIQTRKHHEKACRYPN